MGFQTTVMLQWHMPLSCCANTTTAVPLASVWQGLFVVATDPAPSVRREVCIGLVQMLLARPDVLVPHLGQLIEYMLTSNQVSNKTAVRCWQVCGLLSDYYMPGRSQMHRMRHALQLVDALACALRCTGR